MENKTRKRTIWITISIVIACLLVGGGIYAYTKFLKKTTAELLETVPADAAYVLQVNDNEGFVKTITPCLSNVETLFSLDALSGFEYFVDVTRRNATSNEPIIISGHLDENGKQVALLSMKMDELAYNHLLKELNVNTKDYDSYVGQKIYNVDTHYKNFKFVYRNGLFSACASQQVLKNAINCLANSKSLASQKEFLEVEEIMHKNPKQNWLVIQHSLFTETLTTKVPACYQEDFQNLMSRATWSVYQVRFTESEMILSGYSSVIDNCIAQQLDNQGDESVGIPAKYLPADVANYASLNITDVKTYVANLHTADSVQAILPQINTRELYLYNWNPDTSNYQLAVLKSNDTLEHIMDFLPDSTYMDSIARYKRMNIYRNGFRQLATTYSTGTWTSEMDYFIENQGYYIFANSLDALKKLIDVCAEGKTLDKNQYFLFTKENLPSEYAYEAFYQNVEHSGRADFNFRIFAYNFKNKVGDLLPNNIYIKFATK